MIFQLFSNLVIIHLLAYEDGTDRVFRNVFLNKKFRRRLITQKKTYNIQYTAKV